MKNGGVATKLIYCCTIVFSAIFLFNFSHCKAEEPTVILSEVMPTNYTDEQGVAQKEFVEIYNSSTSPVDLSLWTLNDVLGSVKTFHFPESTIIGAGEYLVLDSNMEGFSISLNDTGDGIELKNQDNLVDRIDYPNITASLHQHSLSRFDSEWKWTNTISRGVANIYLADATDDDNITGDNGKGGQELISIEAAKEKEDKQEVLVQGFVTAVPGQLSASYFYIQDDSGGIQVYNNDQDFPTLTEGDFVSVTGVLSTAYGERRIIIKDMINIVLVPEKHKDAELPKEIIVSDVTEDQVGQYIETSGMVTQTSGDIFSIADSKGKEIKVVIREGTNIDKPAMKKGDTFQVAGVLSSYNGALRILPFKQEDVKIVSATSTILPRAGAPPLIYPILGLALTLLWNVLLTLKRKL